MLNNSQLTAALEKAKPKKRKEVQPEPNKDFVKIISVREQDEPSESEEDSDDDPECIIVRGGYTEKGNIDTPLELAIRNQTDRFSLAMDAIDRMPHLHNAGASAREKLRVQQQAASNEAYENGSDPEYLTNWKWPERKKGS
ncbi:hypothetical protein DL771_009949 [Monosporascus sp. 5C6A]|nr:hypothetical protein DL771_009949 [Monosporascus sp. 5C6A]